MDTYSSGEDLLIKTRKPYTITKQRERWTEEEHNRFLEALKLYGRAWQRIEEHIGSKTAVQIRSHAQKFFTKLEKEALVKGVPVGQALDIEIPPPRPKRKPSNPYPRKTGVEAPNPPVGAKDVISCCHSKQILDLEKEQLPEKPGGDRKPENAKENENDENCSEILTLFHEAPCTSADKKKLSTPVAPRNLCASSKFVRMMEEVINQDEISESHVTAEPRETQKLGKLGSEHLVPNNGANNTSNMGNPNHLHAKLVQCTTTSEQSQPDNFSTLTSNDMQAMQHYPRHIPVHVLDGSPGMSVRNVSPHMSMGGVNNGHPNLFANPAASATTEHRNASSSSVHQSFPTLHPLFTPIRNNQDDDQSFLHLSSAFSSLIVSSLLQNPAAHAAASFAATFLPSATMESSADSLSGTFPSRQMNPAPSMAAIAAATVAAATAWWAAHGLLPLGSPYHPAFTFNPASTSVGPTDAGQTAKPNNEIRERATHDPPLQDQQQDPDNSKSPTLSSSNCEGSQGAKLNCDLTSTDLVKKAEGGAEIHDSNTVKSRKQVDRSSCGSNTPSSSDVEPDALEKNEKEKEESKEPDLSHLAGDSNIRRGGRSLSIINDSWKEVSEEGRVAFRALFSREVLPQSFSPPHGLKSKVHQINIFEKDKNEDEKFEDGSRLDLNSKIWGNCSSHQGVENNEFLGSVNNGEEGLLLMGLGQGKLMARRTGFKPYKRCSVEANESIVTIKGEEKGPKRIRLEGDAST